MGVQARPSVFVGPRAWGWDRVWPQTAGFGPKFVRFVTKSNPFHTPHPVHRPEGGRVSGGASLRVPTTAPKADRPGPAVKDGEAAAERAERSEDP